MFVYLLTYFDSLTLFVMQTIMFEVKTLILHPFIQLKASGRYLILVDI